MRKQAPESVHWLRMGERTIDTETTGGTAPVELMRAQTCTSSIRNIPQGRLRYHRQCHTFLAGKGACMAVTS